MHKALQLFTKNLNNPELLQNHVISWGSPIPSFGSLSKSKLATVGLNPSNCEFVDDFGSELDGDKRRFHTLKSLEIDSWLDIEENHLRQIAAYCDNYFFRNPYDRWFKKLDFIISKTGMSFYDKKSQACHLDLIPYATSCKWTDLKPIQKSTLLDLSSSALGMLLRDSQIKILVLNGQTVVDNLERLTNIKFESKAMKSWNLPRRNGKNVTGIAYKAVVSDFGSIKLNREITILGYNHNIQSSFGVTSEVQTSIRNWIAKQSQDAICK